jgi:hypothetical protein
MTRGKLWIALASTFLAAVPFIIPATAKDEPAAEVDAAKVQVATEVFTQMMSRAMNGEGYDIEDLELWSQHILQAELDLAKNSAARTAAHQAHLRRASELARITASYAKTGQGRPTDALAADSYRLEAQSQLEKLKKP